MCQIFCIAQIFGQIVEHLTVCRIIFLMAFHDTGENIAVIFQSKTVDGLCTWERLKTEFGAETEKIFAVVGKWFLSMPDIPVVGISAVCIIRIVKTAAG